MNEFWCDHCHARYKRAVSDGDEVMICRECRRPTLAVTCGHCGDRSELAAINPLSIRWVCPSCKEAQEMDTSLWREMRDDMEQAPRVSVRFEEENPLAAALAIVFAVVFLVVQTFAEALDVSMFELLREIFG